MIQPNDLKHIDSFYEDGWLIDNDSRLDPEIVTMIENINALENGDWRNSAEYLLMELFRSENCTISYNFRETAKIYQSSLRVQTRRAETPCSISGISAANASNKIDYILKWAEAYRSELPTKYQLNATICAWHILMALLQIREIELFIINAGMSRNNIGVMKEKIKQILTKKGRT